MKYLLTPFTLLIWFTITCYSIYYSAVLMIWMFTLGWFWLIFGYTFLIGLISFLINFLPSIINYFILKLYKLNWFSIITHSIVGFIGIIYSYVFIIENPPEIVNGSQESNIFYYLWNDSWVKTILLLFPFLGLQFGIFHQFVIAPILLKIESSTN